MAHFRVYWAYQSRTLRSAVRAEVGFDCNRIAFRLVGWQEWSIDETALLLRRVVEEQSVYRSVRAKRRYRQFDALALHYICSRLSNTPRCPENNARADKTNNRSDNIPLIRAMALHCPEP